MGDENTPLTTADVRHLLRRAGQGPTPKEIFRLEGLTRGEAADQLLAKRPKPFRPGGRDFEKMHEKWLKYLVKGSRPLQNKLVLFWHDHFSVNISTVGDTKRMGGYVRLLHENALGDMRDFVKLMNKDAAMMDFLDTRRNEKEIPNENYGRELCELFTLGVEDLLGQPNYEQQDVVQIARAFTGWRIGDRNVAFLRTSQHDFIGEFPERGPKTIFTHTGGFGPGGADFAANGEGEPEIDTVIDIIFAHTDSQGENTVARRTTYRLLEYLCHDAPTLGTVDQIVAASGFDTTFDIAALVRAIIVHDVFWETAAPAPWGAGTPKSVKWPIDYVASTMRMLRMKLRGRPAGVQGGAFLSIRDQMERMGQTVLDPPSVFGWDWELGWISSSALLARYNFARDLVASRFGGTRFKPEKLMDLTLTDPAAIVDAVLGVLGIPDQVDAAEHAAFVDYLTDGGLSPTLDLFDEVVRNTKLHGLFALVMQSPAFQLH